MTAPLVYGHPDEGAPAYRRRGWWPLPVFGKTIPPKGATGHEGVITDEKIAEWLAHRGGSNLGLRHDGTIAIDVDHGYAGKDGARHLAAWATGRRLEPLPATWSSTARGADSPSRQYVYRVPDGLALRSKPCVDVEVCQRTHRFTVAWPSVHPDTGRRYTWYGPGTPGTPPAWGRACAPPSVISVPWLPLSWARALAVATQVRTGATGAVDLHDAEALVAGFAPGPPSAYVVDLLGEVCDPAVHLGHDETKRWLMRSMLLGLEGHPGAGDLVTAVVARLSGYLDQARPGSATTEVRGLVDWCARTAQLKHEANRNMFGLGSGASA